MRKVSVAGGSPKSSLRARKWYRYRRRIRLHDARHTAATLMLRAGEHVKVVSQRLGHADVAVTMRVDQHVTAQDDQRAADALGRLLGGFVTAPCVDTAWTRQVEIASDLGWTRWSWGESNPRPSAGGRTRYDRSRLRGCRCPTGGSAGDLDGPHRRLVFPWSQPSFRPSVVFPTVILRFCCRAAADRPRVALLLTMTLHLPEIRRRERTACLAILVGCPV